MKNLLIGAFSDESDNSLKGQIDALKRNGLSWMEIRSMDGQNVVDFSKEKAKEVKKALDENGISVLSIGSPIGKCSISQDRKTEENRLQKAIDVALILGAKYIRIFSFYDTTPNDREEVIFRLKALVKTAQEQGIILCHENEKGIYGDTEEKCLDLLQNVPEMKFVFDPANFVQCGEDTLSAYQLLKPYMQYMHIKDATLDGTVVPIGEGNGHVFEILSDYVQEKDRYLTLEPHLGEFVGLESLERKGEKSKISHRFATNEEAFDYATKKLKETLEKIR